MAWFERMTNGTLQAAVNELTESSQECHHRNVITGVRFESLASNNRLKLLLEQWKKSIFAEILMARLQKGFFPHCCLLYLLLGTYAMFHPSESKTEKNITDKDSNLSTVKMLRSTDFTQSALTWSRAEQELLLQSLLYLEKLCTWRNCAGFLHSFVFWYCRDQKKFVWRHGRVICRDAAFILPIFRTHAFPLALGQGQTRLERGKETQKY